MEAEGRRGAAGAEGGGAQGDLARAAEPAPAEGGDASLRGADPLEMEQFVAKETGSLYRGRLLHPRWGPMPGSQGSEGEHAGMAPAERPERQYGWKEWFEAGDCVVFRDRDWYRKVLAECPESLIIGLSGEAGQARDLHP